MNMTQQGLAPHETMELHELLAFKNLCLTKSQTMQALVQDEQLKGLMQQTVQNDAASIQGLQTLLGQGIRQQ